MAEKIFIIEDDESIRRLLEIALSTSGYAVQSFENAEDALDSMQKNAPDAAIFDIMLDGMSGISAVKKMRENKDLCHIPAIMLTAKDTELDKVLGLDAGADDYITKPFSVLELTARLRAVLRRNKAASKSETFCFGELCLNPDIREVKYQDIVVDLTFKEFELLQLLMKNTDRALTREQLLEAVWGYDYMGETRTLDIHIGTLRHKLHQAGMPEKMVHTVRGIGYRFVP